MYYSISKEVVITFCCAPTKYYIHWNIFFASQSKTNLSFLKFTVIDLPGQSQGLQWELEMTTKRNKPLSFISNRQKRKRVSVTQRNTMCTNKFSGFFSWFWSFIQRNWHNVCYSKYCPSLSTTFDHLAGSIRIPRLQNSSSFEAIQESTQFLASL